MEKRSTFVLFLLQFLIKEQQILVYVTTAALLIAFFHVISFQLLQLQVSVFLRSCIKSCKIQSSGQF